MVIGLGSTVGTTPAISINSDRDVTISDGAIDFDVASHDTSNGLKLGGTLVTATAAELNIMDGVTSTAAEINLIDGGTARGTTAIADGDGVLVNDAGTMRMTSVETLKTYIGGGITEYDQWRITSDAQQSGGGRSVLTSNWERADTNFEVIGTGMSESSGIFTFPSTGKWLVQSNQMWSSSDGSTNYAHVYMYHEIQNTTDNSSYDRIARSVSSNSNAAAEYYQNGYVSTMIDITNVSNDKVCVSAYRAQGCTWKGSSTAQDTGISFMKLGDT